MLPPVLKKRNLSQKKNSKILFKEKNLIRLRTTQVEQKKKKGEAKENKKKKKRKRTCD